MLRRITSPRPGATLLVGTLTLLLSLSIHADLTPDQVADLAPQGAPDGQVDAADVELALRLAAGAAAGDPFTFERGDVAPVMPLAPPDLAPQLVRPNPNPAGPLDIGDAVVIARRAAGLIEFGQLNASPTVSLSGDGDVVSLPAYTANGVVTDDGALDGATVQLLLDGVPEGAPVGVAGDGSFSGSVTLVAASSSITAIATDDEGRIGLESSPILVDLDTDPPLLTLDSPPDNFLTNELTVEVSGTASDDHAYEVEVNGGFAVLVPPDLWGITVDLIVENENTISAIARDVAVPPNEAAPIAITVIRDTTPPALAFDAIPTPTNVNPLTLTGTVSDLWGLASVTVNGTDATVDEGAGTWILDVALIEGDNEFIAVATDNAGNQTTVGSLTIVGDFTPPVVTLLSDGFVNSTPQDVTLGFSEPVIIEHFNGTDLNIDEDSGSHTFNGVALVDGANVLDVTVTDDAGNQTVTTVTITLDTIGPAIQITDVDNPAFGFVPPDGLDGVITNAAAVTVSGTVSDLLSGIASVTVNGYDAIVDEGAGTFIVYGVPLLPRGNPVTAVGTDGAGNISSDAITVHRDAEGPVVGLGFERAAYVNSIAPAPGWASPPAHPRYYDGNNDIVVNGTATDFYDPQVTVATLEVLFNGNPVAVTGSAPFANFSFTIAAAEWSATQLHVLEVITTDTLGNETRDAQSALDGEFALRGAIIDYAAGAALDETGLALVETIIEGEVEKMPGDSLIPPGTSFGAAGFTVNILGLAFCDPNSNPCGGWNRYSNPPYDWNNCNPPGPVPNASPFGCLQDIIVDLSLTPEGHVSIVLEVPFMFVDTYVTSGILCWWDEADGYMTSSPTTISLLADFVNTPGGPELQAVPGSVNINMNNVNIDTQSGCINTWLSIADFLMDFEGLIESEFENQVDSLLDAVGDMLTGALIEYPNTDFELKIAHASNDANGLYLWLSIHGDPCPDTAHFTNFADDSTPDPSDFLACPADSPRVGPGSYATPNDVGSLPDLDLIDPSSSPVSLEAGVNDDYVNYLMWSAWAQGLLDLAIDQDLLGAGAPITLDTNAFSIFIPDLTRSDVVQTVPLGSVMAIELSMMIPPVFEGEALDPATYHVKVGDMFWRFVADTDGDVDNGYEEELFTVAATLFVDAEIACVQAVEEHEDDQIALTLGTPTVHSDVTSNPFIMNEGSIHSAIPTLLDLVLPMLAGSLGGIALPGNQMRFADLQIEAPGEDFLVLSGNLIQIITLVQPPAGSAVSGQTVTISGTVTGLTDSAGATIVLYAADGTTLLNFSSLTRPDGSTLDFSGSFDLDTDLGLADGANTLRLVSTDGNGVQAYQTFTLDRAGTDVTRSGGGTCGCGAGSGGPAGLLLVLGLLGLGIALRRRRRATGLLLTLLAIGLLGQGCDCGGQVRRGSDTDVDSDTDTDADVDTDADTDSDTGDEFTGPAVDPDPVFVVNSMAIGDETQGFNVDEDSPRGDPDPDNAIASLGPLANGALEDAVNGGSVLLLVQIQDMTHLPEPGETGYFRGVGYLGVDLDNDATDNFSGDETFAVDPSSYDDEGNPLIVFESVEISAEADGTVKLRGGPATFTLSIPLGDTSLDLTIDPVFIEATLVVSALRDGGVDANDGLLGGVIPAAALTEEIEGLPFRPLTILKDKVDVDLNGDGTLDKRDSEENEDGLSAGIVFTGVPCHVTFEPVNIPPVVTLTPLADPVLDPVQTVTGEVEDPDGDCALATVEVTVNGTNPIPATLNDGCGFEVVVTLVFGENTIRATATDSEGATGSDEIVTYLDDETPPTITLTGPTGPDVTQADQTLTGIATDNLGVLGVQIDVAGTVYAVPGTELQVDGSFSLPITLPALGENLITAQAKDLADNLSEEATLTLNLLDAENPQVTIDAVSAGLERVEAPGPFVLHATPVTVEGTISDNAGLADLVASFAFDGGPGQVLDFDPATGAYSMELALDKGSTELEVAAQDTAGNAGSADERISIVDNTAPTITVIEPPPLVSETEQTLVFTVEDDFDDAALLSATVALNGGAAQNATYDAGSGQFGLPITLALGENALTIETADLSGNPATLDGTIELQDDTPPTLVVTAPDDGLVTFEVEVDVQGTATDNIGQPMVTIDAGGTEYPAALDADGNFSETLALTMGDNAITVTATDGAGRLAQEIRNVERRDPDSAAAVSLAVDPPVVLIGDPTPVTLTATVDRLAGGPVPDGTEVSFSAAPDTLGLLSAAMATTTAGVATVSFTAGASEGSVLFTANADGVTDQATLIISMPTAVRLGVCLAEGASLAGTAFDLAVLGGGFTASAPAPDAAIGVGPAETWHHYNTASLPTGVYLAGTQAITGAAGGTEFAEVILPIDGGFADLADFGLAAEVQSDTEGVTAAAAGALLICDLEHEISDLPPLVDLNPIASPTDIAAHTVTGTIQDANLATCTSVLSVNGIDTAVDVTSGAISEDVTLDPGPNEIRLTVTDENLNVGTDGFWVTHEAPNEAPVVTITAPGAATSNPDVTVEGAVSDADDGLTGLTVQVTVNGSAPVDAVVDGGTGTWSADVTLNMGNNLIRATATDARGGTGFATQNTELIEPIAPPEITIARPDEGQIFAVPVINLHGSVAEGGNPAQITVTLTVNGEDRPIDFSPFSREFDADVTLDDGDNVLIVRAEDITAQFDEEIRNVQFIAPDDPPVVTITEPADGVRLAATSITVRGTVVDDRPLENLHFLQVNGVDATMDTGTGDWFATVPVSPGSVTLTAVAEDQRSQQGTDSVTIDVVEPPVTVINYLQIGGPNDGFNVDSTPPHPLSDADPDNALSGLGAIANGPLQDAVEGAGGSDPLLLLLEFTGMTALPGPGETVYVDITGYMGNDRDGDPSDNFSGTEAFEIDPSSFDPETGAPLIQFPNVAVLNDFGTIRVDTFPDNPATFHLDIPAVDPPLAIDVMPAYVRTTISEGPNGLDLDPGLLGGVVPAATLAVELTVGEMTIVPLELLISDDPANPVPDVDLNGDGAVDTSDATATNPDGVSVGIVFTAVPARIAQ